MFGHATHPPARLDRRRLLRLAALAPLESAWRAWQTWRADADPWHFDPASEWWLPLVWWNLRDAPGVDGRDRLREAYRHAWIRNQHLLAHAMPALGALRDAGLDTLLLKGAALSATTYARAGVRPFGDVDVLVRTRDGAAAHERLAQLGWVPHRRLPAAALAQLPSVGYTNADGVDLDLHVHALAECCSPGADDGFWARAQPLRLGEIDTRVLAPGDQLVHVCAHGLRVAPVPTSHWIADAVTILRHAGDAFDWESAIAEARRRHLTAQLQRALLSLDPECAAIPARALDRLAAIRTPWWERVEIHAKRSVSRPSVTVQAWCTEARSRAVDPDRSSDFAARLQSVAGAGDRGQLLARSALAALGLRPRNAAHTFDAFGRRIEITFDEFGDRQPFVEALRDRLPMFGAARRDALVDRLYRVLPRASSNTGTEGYRVLVNRGPLATAASLGEAADHVVTDLQAFLAMAVPGRTFIHAGVVVIDGRAIVLPGDSGCGKSRLVAALVRAGGTYRSDEFAIVDREGRVDAYARPIRLRRADGASEYVRPRVRRSRAAAAPPAGVVLLTAFRPGASFSPQPMAPSAALLRLLRHCPGAQSRPAETMADVRALVERARVWSGDRGEADVVVRALMDGSLLA